MNSISIHRMASRLMNFAVAAAVWSGGLSASAEVVAQWDFDLPSGVAIGDSYVPQADSINGLVMLQRNGTHVYSTAAPGNGSSAINNDSGGGLVAALDNDILTGHQGGGTGYTEFTIDTYIKLNELITSGTQTIARKTGLGTTDNNTGWVIYAQQSGRIAFEFQTAAGSNSIGRATATNVLTQTDVWYHVVANWDGTQYTLSVDGAQVGSAVAYAGPFVNTDGVLSLGGFERLNGTFTQIFQGQVDELRISGSPVPEPASLSLLLMSSLTMLGRRRCR